MSECATGDKNKRARALDRIKKCFALAKSSNPHEAEAAMRQARKLMDKFKLEIGDVHATQTEEFSLRIGKAKSVPPQWIRMLSMTVSKAFGCVSFYSYGPDGQSLIFIGEIGSAEMSAYAYEVLIQQMKDSKRKYLSGVSIQGTVQRRKAGVLYAEAWIIGVHKRVEEFSGITEEVERAIHAYTQRNYPGVPVTKMKRRKLDMDAYRAYIQGKRDGESVSLHKPMGRDEHRQLELE
ncbi:DUF2786 domain-containing protein [Pseudomonas veronii]|uniref:DUF2786 domain-containing protein n=1 Tax=Pseudomonas veronii TaxID=76761 RepID=UPI0012320DFB|nr:DUF2786 domain-containing protein [Pseudomonas veronii]KAA6183115.1 DUF2786 domain-containing protein [Pseudomonas veronii]